MIELKNVSKVVRSGAEDLTILDNVSLEIPDGEFVAITGASGSGKSTLLGLIAGLDAPTEGSVRFAGKRPELGYVFQEPTLMPWATARRPS